MSWNVGSMALLTPFVSSAANAEETTAITDSTSVAASQKDLLPAVEMRKFVDPVGYFDISVPKSFFAIRRSAKGDLPDAKTGKGRRGSSIFSAGDLAKAQVVSVERYVYRESATGCR